MSLFKLSRGVCSNRDNIFIQFCVLRTVEDAGPYKVGFIMPVLWHLRGVEHIFNENAVPRGGIVDENMGHRSHELAVLDNGATVQVCGQ